MVFGAYHFARPDDTANDAILEADHFVDVAQLEPGDLVPVLDIERTGGLSQAQVTQWILTWLNRVTERVGVRPMVYTSPHGWATRTGDTTAVADAGYSLLWVAHWSVASPTVPGANWSGNGWTFWQYGNCGTVPGIDGCVDVDWYETGSFDPVTIRRPTTYRRRRRSRSPATPAEPVVDLVQRDRPQVTPENAFVWIPGTGTYPTWSSRAVRAREPTSTASRQHSQRARATARIVVLGETYEAVVNPAIAPVLVVDRSANPVSPHAGLRDAHRGRGGQPGDLLRLAHGLERGREGRLVRGGAPGRRDRLVRLRRRVGHLVHGRWSEPGQGQRPDRRRREGHVRPVRRAAGVPCRADLRRARTGRAFDHDPRARPGAREGDRRAGRRGRVPCRRGARPGSGPGCDLGHRRAGLGLGWEPRLERPRAFERRGDVPRDRDRLVYRAGTRPGAGQDLRGRGLVRTVDNYARSPAFGVARSIAGLTDGVHTLRIVVLATARPAATGALVSVDRFSIVP